MKFTKLAAVLSLVLLTGCSAAPKEQEKINVLVPQGAPALATLSIDPSNQKEGNVARITTVNGSDAVTTELAKEDGEYDMIIAPINLGAKMIEKQGTSYRMASVITWGNLYVVAAEGYQEGDPLAAFGENSVPQKVLEKSGIPGDVTYFSGPQDVQAQLISGKFKAGMLAEPAATATIKKAKEQGLKLDFAANVQLRYLGEDVRIPGGPHDGYPQAAIFIKEGKESACAEALKQIEKFLNEEYENTDNITKMIETIGAENLGVPNAGIAVATWERQNLYYVNASEAKNEITKFLSLFNITFTDDMISK